MVDKVSLSFLKNVRYLKQGIKIEIQIRRI